MPAATYRRNPLRPLLEEACRQARFLDPRRSITLDAEEITIETNRDALKQTLLIVLDNALKHSPGDVAVTARSSGGRVEIRIRDSGEGIPPAQLDHITRFNTPSPLPLMGKGGGLHQAISEKEVMRGRGLGQR